MRRAFPSRGIRSSPRRDDKALFEAFFHFIVPVLAFAFPERGDGEQGVVVRLEGVPVQVHERGHLIQHGRSLRRVKTEISRRAALLEREGDFHAAPRGEAPDYAFQTGFQPPAPEEEAAILRSRWRLFTPVFPTFVSSPRLP